MENIINKLKQKLEEMGITPEKISEIGSKIDPRKFDMNNLEGVKHHIMEIMDNAQVESGKAAEAVKQAFSTDNLNEKLDDAKDAMDDMLHGNK